MISSHLACDFQLAGIAHVTGQSVEKLDKDNGTRASAGREIIAFEDGGEGRQKE